MKAIGRLVPTKKNRFFTEVSEVSTMIETDDRYEGLEVSGKPYDALKEYWSFEAYADDKVKIEVFTAKYEYMGLPCGFETDAVYNPYGGFVEFTHKGKTWKLYPAEYYTITPDQFPNGTNVVQNKQDALAVQIGGGHYKKCKIQPIEYIFANGLGYAEGNIVKYVTRWRDKNGVEDLKKIIHYVELLIQEEEKKDE